MESSTRQAVSSEDFSPLMAKTAPMTNSVSSEDFSPLINNGAKAPTTNKLGAIADRQRR
ncbi:MAG: hypothetical protein RIE73_12350 [Coleofasciculus sp. C1-SOL-03]